MKKIPTLFKREYIDHCVVRTLPIVTPGMEWVLAGEGLATEQLDGSCCAIIDGVFYKRYDAKNGKPVPECAIKCQDEPDPITGHLPCWVKVDKKNPADKWFLEAYYFTSMWTNQGLALEDGTYEAIGRHFSGNPYKVNEDYIVRHGISPIDVERSFEGIKKYLAEHYIYGIVFWKDGEPKCKIKRSDFGLEWNKK